MDTSKLPPPPPEQMGNVELQEEISLWLRSIFNSAAPVEDEVYERLGALTAEFGIRLRRRMVDFDIEVTRRWERQQRLFGIGLAVGFIVVCVVLFVLFVKGA